MSENFDPLSAHLLAQQEFHEAHEPPDRNPGRAHEIADLEAGLRRGGGVTIRAYIHEPVYRASAEVIGGDARRPGNDVQEVRGS